MFAAAAFSCALSLVAFARAPQTSQSTPAPQANVRAQANSPAPPSNPPTQAIWLDAPARELASRIAASLPAETPVQIEIRNESSLGDRQISAVRGALTAELDARGFHARDAAASESGVIVTLSENVESYVWIAQIQRADSSAVILQSIPRAAAPPASPPESEQIVLHKDLLWSGPSRVLTATESFAAGFPPGLLLLELDGATPVVTSPQSGFRVELPSAGPLPRDAEGSFENSPGQIAVSLSLSETVAEDCTVSLGGDPMGSCARRQVERAAADSGRRKLPLLPGDQAAPLSTACADGEVLLGTGNGDDTQPDTVVAYALAAEIRALSAPLSFPGPVTRLWTDDATSMAALAMARNLQTGNYEVYRIAAYCGQ